MGLDIERLRALDLFADLDYHDLSHVARWAHEVHAETGAILFEQDAIPYDLFVIESGSAEVIRDKETLATLGPGDPVGEMSVLRHERRSATVRVLSALTAIAIPAEDLDALEAEMPEIVGTLRRVMNDRSRRNEADRNLP